MTQTVKSLVVAAFLFSGCSSFKPAVERKVDNEKTITITFDKVWTKVVSYVSSNGMNVKTIDKSSGLISFERSYDEGFTAKYMDCGQLVSASKSTKEREEDEKKGIKNTSGLKVSDGLVSMNFFIEKTTEKETKVRINIFGKVTIPGGMSYGVSTVAQSYPCYSNGNFEQEVFSNLTK